MSILFKQFNNFDINVFIFALSKPNLFALAFFMLFSIQSKSSVRCNKKNYRDIPICGQKAMRLGQELDLSDQLSYRSAVLTFKEKTSFANRAELDIKFDWKNQKHSKRITFPKLNIDFVLADYGNEISSVKKFLLYGDTNESVSVIFYISDKYYLSKLEQQDPISIRVEDVYAIVELSAEECCRIKFAEDTRNNISLKSHYENENNHKYRLIDFPFDRKIEGAEYKINIRNDDIQNGDQNTLKSINININTFLSEPEFIFNIKKPIVFEFIQEIKEAQLNGRNLMNQFSVKIKLDDSNITDEKQLDLNVKDYTTNNVRFTRFVMILDNFTSASKSGFTLYTLSYNDEGDLYLWSSNHMNKSNDKLIYGFLHRGVLKDKIALIKNYDNKKKLIYFNKKKISIFDVEPNELNKVKNHIIVSEERNKVKQKDKLDVFYFGSVSSHLGPGALRTKMYHLLNLNKDVYSTDEFETLFLRFKAFLIKSGRYKSEISVDNLLSNFEQFNLIDEDMIKTNLPGSFFAVEIKRIERSDQKNKEFDTFSLVKKFKDVFSRKDDEGQSARIALLDYYARNSIENDLFHKMIIDLISTNKNFLTKGNKYKYWDRLISNKGKYKDLALYKQIILPRDGSIPDLVEFLQSKDNKNSVEIPIIIENDIPISINCYLNKLTYYSKNNLSIDLSGLDSSRKTEIFTQLRPSIHQELKIEQLELNLENSKLDELSYHHLFFYLGPNIFKINFNQSDLNFNKLSKVISQKKLKLLDINLSNVKLNSFNVNFENVDRLDLILNIQNHREDIIKIISSNLDELNLKISSFSRLNLNGLSNLNNLTKLSIDLSNSNGELVDFSGYNPMTAHQNLKSLELKLPRNIKLYSVDDSKPKNQKLLSCIIHIDLGSIPKDVFDNIDSVNTKYFSLYAHSSHITENELFQIIKKVNSQNSMISIVGVDLSTESLFRKINYLKSSKLLIRHGAYLTTKNY